MHKTLVLIALCIFPKLLLSSDHRIPSQLRSGRANISSEEMVKKQQASYLSELRKTLDEQLKDISDDELEASVQNGRINYHVLAAQFLQRPQETRDSDLHKTLFCLLKAHKEAKIDFERKPSFYSALNIAAVAVDASYRLITVNLKDAVRMLKTAGHYCDVARTFLNIYKGHMSLQNPGFRNNVADFILKLLFSINSSESESRQSMRPEKNQDKVKLSTYAQEVSRRLSSFAPQTHQALITFITDLLKRVSHLEKLNRTFDVHLDVDGTEPFLQKINGIMSIGFLSEVIAQYYSLPENWEKKMDEKILLESFLEKNPNFSRTVATRLIKIVHHDVRNFMQEFREVRQPTLLSYLEDCKQAQQDVWILQDAESVQSYDKVKQNFVAKQTAAMQKIADRYRRPLYIYEALEKDLETKDVQDIKEEFAKQGVRLGIPILQEIGNISKDARLVYCQQKQEKLAAYEDKTVLMLVLYKLLSTPQTPHGKEEQQGYWRLASKVSKGINQTPEKYEALKKELIRPWPRRVRS